MLKTFILLALLFCQVSLADTGFAKRLDVQQFIQYMVKTYDFNEATLNSTFNQVKIVPSVMEHINAPYESLTWHRYQKLFVTKANIRGGIKFAKRNATALHKAEKKYGVPASVIVATIGVESKYGKDKGHYLVIESLSNIAFSGSTRAKYFLNELVHFFLLTRERKLNPLKVKGSYAGAIGQPQFMPSSYRLYAVNFSGKKSIDLSNNNADVIASIANYYSKKGWEKGQKIVIPMRVNKRRNAILQTYLHEKNLVESKQLARLGLKPLVVLPRNKSLKIIALESLDKNEYWLGLPNFDVIKRYNASNLYAMAVFQLSTKISKQKESRYG